MKILLIDDDPLLFQDILNAHNYSVDVATNGYQALKLFTSKAEKYDLILLDVKMPVMDGWEVLRFIRNNPNPNVNRLFVIMLTADNSEDSIAGGLQKGADLYLTKPISLTCFLEHIRAVERRLSIFAKQTQRVDCETVTPKVQYSAMSNLTKREFEILDLLCKGFANKEIADELSISETTVKNHLAKSYIKMSVKNRMQASIAFSKNIRVLSLKNKQSMNTP